MAETEGADRFIQIDKMSVDQAAGAFVMVAGAIGSLLLVIWQSKCHCKVNLCYIFSCERRPPNEEEMKSLKDQAKELKEKNKDKQKQDIPELRAEEARYRELEEKERETPRLVPKSSNEGQLNRELEAERATDEIIDRLV